MRGSVARVEASWRWAFLRLDFLAPKICHGQGGRDIDGMRSPHPPLARVTLVAPVVLLPPRDLWLLFPADLQGLALEFVVREHCSPNPGDS